MPTAVATIPVTSAGLMWAPISGKVVDNASISDLVPISAPLRKSSDGTEAGSALFVARAKYKGHTLVGHVSAGASVCYVPYEGVGEPIFSFEVLRLPAGSYKWESATDGALPDGALQAGIDRLGHGLYIARAKIGQYYHAGKFLPRTKRAFVVYGYIERVRSEYDVLCIVSKGDDAGTEKETGAGTVKEPEKAILNPSVKVPEKAETQISAPDAPRGLLWFPGKHGSFAAGAVSGGAGKGVVEGSGEMLIARAREPRELCTGLFDLEKTHALLPYHGTGIAHEAYEVLAYSSPRVTDMHLIWVFACLGEVPEKAFGEPVQCGANINGEPIYVARGNVAGTWIPGKLVPCVKRGYVAKDGKEYTRKMYQVLIVAPGPAPEKGSQQETDLKSKIEQTHLEACKRVLDGEIPKPVMPAVAIALGYPAPSAEATPIAASSPVSASPPTVAPQSAGGDATLDRSLQSIIPDEKCIPTPPGMRWTSCEDGAVPGSALFIGRAHDEPVYVIRAVDDGVLVVGGIQVESPGKVPSPTTSGLAVSVERYAVLSLSGADTRYKWARVRSAQVPENAVQGGFDQHGRPTYVARARITADGDYSAGSFNPAEMNASFPWMADAANIDGMSKDVEILLSLEPVKAQRNGVLYSIVGCAAILAMSALVATKITKQLAKE